MACKKGIFSNRSKDFQNKRLLASSSLAIFLSVHPHAVTSIESDGLFCDLISVNFLNSV